jgi:HEAT repeat protein
MRMCDSLETNIRAQVIALVGSLKLDEETRLEFLLERIDDAEPAVKRAAWSGVCQILGHQAVQYRRDEVVARLLAQLEDPDPDVRRTAANALASIKEMGAVPSLHSLATGDSDERVRRDAVRAIETIEGRNRCCSCDVPVP